MIPDFKTFEKEVEKIDNPKTKEKLFSLYEHLKGIKKLDNKRELLKEVFSSLFSFNIISTSILIPYEFLDTNIGKVLFLLFYDFESEEKKYTVADLILMTKSDEKPKGFSKAYISKEIAAGNLKGTINNGRYYFSTSQINNYLERKGFNKI